MLSKACLKLGVFLYFKIYCRSRSSASGLASYVFLMSLIFFARLAVRFNSSIGFYRLFSLSDWSDSLSSSSIGYWELSLSLFVAMLGLPNYSNSCSSTDRIGKLIVLFLTGDFDNDLFSGDGLSSTLRLLFFVGDSCVPIVPRLSWENLLVNLGWTNLLGLEISCKSILSRYFFSRAKSFSESWIS